jgi:hypothetical protein
MARIRAWHSAADGRHASSRAAGTPRTSPLGRASAYGWVRVLMLLLGLSWARALVPLQAATFATITPAATGPQWEPLALRTSSLNRNPRPQLTGIPLTDITPAGRLRFRGKTRNTRSRPMPRSQEIQGQQ